MQKLPGKDKTLSDYMPLGPSLIRLVSERPLREQKHEQITNAFPWGSRTEHFISEVGGLQNWQKIFFMYFLSAFAHRYSTLI